MRNTPPGFSLRATCAITTAGRRTKQSTHRAYAPSIVLRARHARRPTTPLHPMADDLSRRTLFVSTRPGWPAEAGYALRTHALISGLVANSTCHVLFVAPQDWKTYRLLVASSQGKIADFDKSTRTAQTDADRQKAFQALFGSIVFRVYDLQQQKMIDDKTFVKNFFAP